MLTLSISVEVPEEQKDEVQNILNKINSNNLYSAECGLKEYIVKYGRYEVYFALVTLFKEKLSIEKEKAIDSLPTF